MNTEAERVVPAAHSAGVAALAVALTNYTQAIRQPGDKPVCTVEARDANAWDPLLYAAASLTEDGCQQMATDLQQLTRERLANVEH